MYIEESAPFLLRREKHGSNSTLSTLDNSKSPPPRTLTVAASAVHGYTARVYRAVAGRRRRRSLAAPAAALPGDKILMRRILGGCAAG